MLSTATQIALLGLINLNKTSDCKITSYTNQSLLSALAYRKVGGNLSRVQLKSCEKILIFFIILKPS